MRCRPQQVGEEALKPTSMDIGVSGLTIHIIKPI
jgi:hypothetical protein